MLRIAERRYFTKKCTETNTNKFWAIWGNGCLNVVHFGRIGTQGQRRHRKFDDEFDAEYALQSLTIEKRDKGYNQSYPIGYDIVDTCEVCHNGLFAGMYNRQCFHCGSYTKIAIGVGGLTLPFASEIHMAHVVSQITGSSTQSLPKTKPVVAEHKDPEFVVVSYTTPKRKFSI